MKDLIISVLKECGVREYILSETTQESAELFFIKKSLDMKRAKKVTTYNVVVYTEFEKKGKKCKGSSPFTLFPGTERDEIKKSVESAMLAASFVANPTYKLAEVSENGFVTIKSDMLDNSMEENVRIMADALFAEDNRTDVFLNSAEMFLYDTTVRIYNSNGIDEGYRKLSVSGEFVAQCKTPQDVETYKDFKYNRLDTEALKRKVRTALEYTKSRAEAKEAPATGSYRLILSDEYMNTLFDFYKSKADASYIYADYSDYKVGRDVQTSERSTEVSGDRITLTLKAAEPYSPEGLRMKDHVLLDRGILKNVTGNLRFAQYIGIEPTGQYSDYRVEPGTTPVEEMKKKPYLHVVNFSDFQMDDFTGHFGGEIRLAYLFDGEKVTPVTGGSVNGSWFDVQGRLTLSKEMQTEKGYEGPLAVCMENIPVAGK